MSEMILVETRPINAVPVDGYYLADDGEAWFSRQQIGECLEYEEPRKEIQKIHARHKERLDQFSMCRQIDDTLGRKQEVILYNTRGVLEICRWSRQPKADAVMDALYDMAMEVMKKGYYSVYADELLIEKLTEKISRAKRLGLKDPLPAIRKAANDRIEAENQAIYEEKVAKIAELEAHFTDYDGREEEYRKALRAITGGDDKLFHKHAQWYKDNTRKSVRTGQYTRRNIMDGVSWLSEPANKS